MSESETPRSDGRRLRWERHKHERRRLIVQAASEAFEAAGPGAEVHVHDIAKRAGMNRSVVYRHFEDRADLDRAVRHRVFRDLGALLQPELRFEGTPMQIIHRLVGGYLGWAEEHPALHEFAQRGGMGELDAGLQQIADRVGQLVATGIDVLGVDLDDDERAALDPLVFGIVGTAYAAVRRWLARDVREPGREPFTTLVSEMVWLQLHGLVSRRGVDLRPDLPLEQLLENADVAEDAS